MQLYGPTWPWSRGATSCWPPPWRAWWPGWAAPAATPPQSTDKNTTSNITASKDDIVGHLLEQRHLPPEGVVPAPGEGGPEAGGQAPHPLLALPGLGPRHARVVDEGQVVTLPDKDRVFIQT